MIRPGRATVIVGGQFGSEAKGLIAAWLAARASPPGMISTTNAGAQAGHTTVLEDGSKMVCYHLPTVGALIPDARIYLNAGSIIDPELLDREVKNVAQVLGRTPDSFWGRITIHPNASMIDDGCKAVEAGGEGTVHLASTGKGVGAALSRKIMRRPGATVGTQQPYTFRQHGFYRGTEARIWPIELTHLMEPPFDSPVVVEVPQGTGLSINAAPFYPHCTSRDCWVGQGLADAGIPPYYLGRVIMVCRTFPIRVGHVYADGGKVGDSGAFFHDSRELSWNDFPGVEPEKTTVTQRIRRIATWSNDQYEHSLRLNRPDLVALTFVNYLDNPDTLRFRVEQMRRLERAVGLTPIHLYSWGPKVSQCSHSLIEAELHTRAGVVA